MNVYYHCCPLDVVQRWWLLFSAKSLLSHGLQHTRLPCPSLSPRDCSNSCPSSQWCHLILCHPLLLCPPIFPSFRIFSNELALRIRWQSIGTSASVLPMNIQGWFPLGLTGLISLQSNRPSRVFSSTTVRTHQFFGAQPSLWSNSHICAWLQEKP